MTDSTIQVNIRLPKDLVDWLDRQHSIDLAGVATQTGPRRRVIQTLVQQAMEADHHRERS
jgi:hypothetical protein